MEDNELYYATNDKGKRLPFEVTHLDGSILLTLKKEYFRNAKRVYALPRLGAASAGDSGYWILPRTISYLCDIQTFFTARDDMIYRYNSAPVMSCYGIKTKERTCLVRIYRNYHYSFEIKVENGNYTVTPIFDFTSNDTPDKDIMIEIVPLDGDADYNDMAKAERELRLWRREIVPLAEKCRRDAVEYARKYPLIRIRMGWKPSPSPVWQQTEENEPDMFVACDFARVRDIADELKRQGVKGAELQLVGWNRSGHDGRFPQLFPADPRLGGNDGLKKTIDHIKALGYRVSTHTNSIDAVPIADTFSWDDIAVNRDGTYVQVGHYSGGLAYHVCLSKQYKNTLRDLPRLAAYGENGLHFTDVVSIVVPDCCYSESHPSDTENGIIYAQKIIETTSGMFGGFSSEGSMDFALKDLDFALYVCFGDGFGHTQLPFADRYIPFFELTYHGTLLYNPASTTVNYTVKGNDERLRLYLRGGRPVMYYYSKFRTGGQKNWMGDTDLVCDTDDALKQSVSAIKRAAEEYAAHADRQLVYMERYDIQDNGLEIASYADGSRVVGNFSDSRLTFEGHTVEPMDYIVL